MPYNLKDLDKQLWKELKKNAGIKKAGFFKKADASIGKYIENLNKAREKFQRDDLLEDLVEYHKALEKLAENFDKFVEVKHLDAIDEDDLNREQKEELRREITKWSQQIQTEYQSMLGAYRRINQLAEEQRTTINSLDKQKKKEVWKSIGVPGL